MATKGIFARDLPCTILSIDPGAASGWAHNGAGAWTVGTASSWRERYAVVADAWQLEGQGRPLVVVAEQWTKSGGRPFPVATIAGLGAQWGRWLAELERLDVPARRVVRLTTGDWRRVVLGGVRCRSTEAWKAASRARAHAVLGHDPGPDAADALCIGLAGLRSPAVAAAIGVRELRRLGWEER
jgi:hypothetical protein